MGVRTHVNSALLQGPGCQRRKLGPASVRQPPPPVPSGTGSRREFLPGSPGYPWRSRPVGVPVGLIGFLSSHGLRYASNSGRCRPEQHAFPARLCEARYNWSRLHRLRWAALSGARRRSVMPSLGGGQTLPANSATPVADKSAPEEIFHVVWGEGHFDSFNSGR